VTKIISRIFWTAAFGYIVWQLFTDTRDMVGSLATSAFVWGGVIVSMRWLDRKQVRAELERQVREGLADGTIDVFDILGDDGVVRILTDPND
jgi:hypothetical protein